MVPEGRKVKPDADDGHGGHLVDVYAHNDVKEVIKEARDKVHEERGRFTLPSYFLDELAVECGKMILEKGAEVAERCAHDRIIEFLIKMEKAKHEDNERKVRARLPHESRERRDS
jgi:hypothetical protein